jgi:hypothetical protein
VFGNYALKLPRLQLDLIQALDRHRRGNKAKLECKQLVQAKAKNVAINNGQERMW